MYHTAEPPATLPLLRLVQMTSPRHRNRRKIGNRGAGKRCRIDPKPPARNLSVLLTMRRTA